MMQSVALGIAATGTQGTWSTLAQEATPAATPGASAVTPQEAQAIARDAYIYGYPIVENYKTIYAYAIDEGGSNYKAPFNQITNLARVFTPAGHHGDHPQLRHALLLRDAGSARRAGGPDR